MGLFDTVTGRILCPHCGRQTQVETQTKALGCQLRSIKVGAILKALPVVPGEYGRHGCPCRECGGTMILVWRVEFVDPPEAGLLRRQRVAGIRGFKPADAPQPRPGDPEEALALLPPSDEEFVDILVAKALGASILALDRPHEVLTLFDPGHPEGVGVGPAARPMAALFDHLVLLARSRESPELFVGRCLVRLRPETIEVPYLQSEVCPSTRFAEMREPDLPCVRELVSPALHEVRKALVWYLSEVPGYLDGLSIGGQENL